MAQSIINDTAREHEEVTGVLKRAKLLMEEMMQKQQFLPLARPLNKAEMGILLISQNKVSSTLEKLSREPETTDVDLREFCDSDMMLIRLHMHGIRTVMDMWRFDSVALTGILAPGNDTAGRHQWHMHCFVRPAGL